MFEAELHQLAPLAAEEAERRHFDARNWRTARFFWLTLAAISLIATLAWLEQGDRVRALLAAANLVALASVFGARKRPAFARGFASLLFALTAVELILWVMLASELPLAVTFLTLLGAPALATLRFRPSETAALAGLALAAVALRAFLIRSVADEMPPAAALAAGGTFLVAGSIVGIVRFRRQRRDFLATWQRAHLAEKDRVRMREGLEGARAIQLAMLPSGEPDLDWLELAATSRPATEVGGDYYDFFALGGDRLAVAIGDVAGHGLGSGIVLAGVRAGLHLLRDDLGSPERVLERLNGVVRDAGPERLLMTLGILLLDRGGRARWVPAGHPPALRWSPGAPAAVAVAASCPPLGTRLPVKPSAVELPLGDGDVWLLTSDGTFETRDPSGAPFGEARLAAELAALAAAGAGAREILDGLLLALDRHRGGGEPEDDLTAVVVRRRDRV